MAAPKIVSGARAKAGIMDPNTGKFTPLGIFNSASYSVQYGTQAVYILGRLTPAEIEYTHCEPVQLSLTAWRAVNHGPHKSARMPSVDEVLGHEYLTIAIEDRVTGQLIAVIKKVRPSGYSTAVNARQLTEYTWNAVGILVDDEDTVNVESTGASPLASDLP